MHVKPVAHDRSYQYMELSLRWFLALDLGEAGRQQSLEARSVFCFSAFHLPMASWFVLSFFSTYGIVLMTDTFCPAF